MRWAAKAARDFADTLLDEIVGVLSTNQVEAVSRTESVALRGPDARREIERLGVGLVLDGIVQSDGKRFTVRAHLDDAKRHVTLWSKTFTGPIQDAVPLQAQIAGGLTHMTAWAASPAVDGVRDQPDVLAASLRAEEEFEDMDLGRELADCRQIVARAPNFSAGHAQLAWAIMLSGSFGLPIDGRGTGDWVVEATREAKRAVAIDPADGWAYSLLGGLQPPAAWREREALDLTGVANGANDDYRPHGWYSDFLEAAGRNGDALAQARLAVAADPLSPTPRYRLIEMLVVAGAPEEAAASVAEARRLWPHNVFITLAYVRVAAWTTKPSLQAVALFDDPDVDQVIGPVGAAAPWRTVAKARASGDAAQEKAAARMVAAAADSGDVVREEAIAAIAALSDADAAFQVAARLYPPAYLRHARRRRHGINSGPSSRPSPRPCAATRASWRWPTA